MLHNSLHRRELLKSMNAHPLCVRRRDVHRHVGRVDGTKPVANQVMLEGAWAVETSTDHSAERAVARDAEDFLKRMGVTLDPKATNRLRLEIGSRDTGFRLLVEPNRVEVHAADTSSLWAGWVQLEYQMRMASGPLLTKGEHEAEPAWGVQIAPPAWGANYAVPDLSPEFLGDDTFRSLAHAGADGMFVYGDFLLYATGTKFPELEHADAVKHLKTLRDATERALAYGIRLYYVVVSPKLKPDHPLFQRLPEVRGAQIASPSGPLHGLCSSSPDALGFHGDVMGRLFTEAPELGGLICIIGGESYYHCFMRVAGAPVGETNCP